MLDARAGLRPGAVWADLNTAVARGEGEPGRGRRADVAVVDVALMSPVPGKGLRTPMLVSGGRAERYAALLRPLGAEVTVQPGPAGAAISRKLLRSVFYKGLAAAVVEALEGAEAAGCADWLAANIAARAAPGSTSGPRPSRRRHPPRTPGAAPTRWPRPPSSCASSASSPARATAAHDLLASLRDAREGDAP